MEPHLHLVPAQAITVSNGTVNITAGGEIAFTPDANFNSATALSIPYVITDGTTTATANELITVTAVNDAPVAVNDTYTVAEDGTVTLLPLTDDTDVDGNTLSIVSINGTTLTPGTAQAITVSNGTVNITAGGEIAFTPDANFNSATAVSIPYVITDGTTTATANELITVTAVNDAPVAVNDTYTVAEDGTVTLLPLTDDTDVDGNTLSIVSINGTTLTPGNAQAITVSNGTVNITAGGEITFTSDANFNSATALSIPYVITDGTTTATANELITVTAVNDAPVAVNDSYTVAEDGTVILLPLTDDTDVDGNALSIVSINGTTLTPGTAQVITVSNGTVNITAGGEITFTPDANFNSATALSIPYVITDGTTTATANELITVTAVNDAPVATANPVITPEDTVVNGTVTGSDVDGDALTFTKTTDPTHGTVTLNPDGTYTYTPNTNYTGNDSFDVTVSDGKGGSTVVTVNVTVTTVNDAPVATANPVTTPEDTAVNGTVTGSDVDGDALTFTKTTDPTHGTVTLNPDGTYTYTPNTNYTGNDSFDVTVSDGKGGSAVVTVNVTVTPVNDAPVATANPVTTPEDTAVNGTVTGSDVDGDALTFTKTTDPTHGTATLNPDGTYTYTPNTDYTGNDSFDVTVSDGKGGSTVVTVNVTVTQVNDAPVATAIQVTTPEDTAVNGTVTGSDVDGDALTFTKTTDPAHGTVTLNPDGTYTYTPNTDYAGNDSFDVTVSDGKGGSTVVTVNVTVTPVNDNPVATNDYYVVNEDSEITQNLSTNDKVSLDGNNVWTVATSPSYGSVFVNVDGTFTYTPNLNSNATDSFTYTITDKDGDTSTATVTITVNGLPEIIKTASAPKRVGDNVFTWVYTIVVNNDTNLPIDSVQVTDDLDNVFKGKNCTFSVTSVLASGKLKANTNFNGIANTKLLIEDQAMSPNTKDSIMIEIKVQTQNQTDSIKVYNQAILNGKSNQSKISLLSDAILITKFPDPTDTAIPYIFVNSPDGFTPNGDGSNNTYVVDHSPSLKIEFEVYNRWGNIVYKTSDYKNDWDGTGNGSFFGQQLPNGTYFCICKAIDIKTGELVSNTVKAVTLRR